MAWGESQSAAAVPPPAAPARPASGAGAHLPALDGVRGCAVLLVMAYHFASSAHAVGFANPMFDAPRVGWLGVDVFFALSGFLITGILVDTKTAADYFRSFYARRVLRIFPLYYGAVLAVLALWALLPGAGIWGDHATALSPASLLWPGLFLENAGLAVSGPLHAGVLAHYWSLAVEEHFYLLWPTLVWFASRRQIAWMAGAAAALSIAGRVLVLDLHLRPDLLFALTPLRLDGLAIGALTALLVRSPWVAAARRLAPAAFVASLALLVGLCVVRGAVEQDDPALFVAAFPLAALATACAIVAASAPGRAARALAIRPLRWFGRYSYGLYVWHPIVGMLLFHSQMAILPEAPSAPRMLGAIAIAFALDLAVAWLSFHLWEQRFLALKRFFPADRAAKARPLVVAPIAAPAPAQSPTQP